jgi:nitrogen-specific signal transduction histidine kinase
MPAHCCLLGGGTPEAVTNALLNPAATVRIWAAPNRIVVHVHDNGPGPPDPLAGLIPPPASSAAGAELGLWLTHQLDIDVALIYGDDGFTVRLRGGTITG